MEHRHETGQDLLRFITCGSVDDGKSTLIGRLLWESGHIYDDQLEALRSDSRRHGTQGGELDLALLLDGLAAEREQGITIDVAYRFFSTPRRKFIVADTPGHEQYTRNMFTGASTADVAVLLIDARRGILTQTRRHAYLASLVGIEQLILAINKMDLVDYSAETYAGIRQSFDEMGAGFGFKSLTAIPISALKGDNITRRSPRMPWYSGPTLLDSLESAPVPARQGRQLVFPVQRVNRLSPDIRGLCGTLASGAVAVGDALRVTASGQLAHVLNLVSMDGETRRASAGQAITLQLDRDVDVSRGDVLTQAEHPVGMTDQFEATIVWMHEEPGLVGRSYEIKLATQWAAASMTTIKHRVDPNTLAHEACTQLSLNDIAVCNLALGRPLAFDAYANSRALGAFILVDRFTHATVAAGMIRHSLRRARNVHRQPLTVTREARESQNGHRGQVVWLTGLSGSGKSTLANALETALHGQGKRTYLLDGDNVRQGLNRDLGFTDADRVENIRRVAEVAKLMMDAGLIVLTSFISPFRQEREMARELIGSERFHEVYISTPLDVCEQRDPKGLYRKARDGEIPNMTGIGSPYEPPAQPELVVDGTLPVEDNVRRMLAHIGEKTLW